MIAYQFQCSEFDKLVKGHSKLQMAKSKTYNEGDRTFYDAIKLKMFTFRQHTDKLKKDKILIFQLTTTFLSVRITI